MGTIALEGIRLHAYHGCLPEEALTGTEYEVNIFIKYDYTKAAITDELHDTVDYVVIYEIVKEQMAIRSKLIEHVAKRIYDAILQKYPNTENIEVHVSKTNPPVNGSVEKSTVIFP